jgi:hypothetical protein
MKNDDRSRNYRKDTLLTHLGQSARLPRLDDPVGEHGGVRSKARRRPAF